MLALAAAAFFAAAIFIAVMTVATGFSQRLVQMAEIAAAYRAVRNPRKFSARPLVRDWQDYATAAKRGVVAVNDASARAAA